jgi:exodeoxyribonuclease X
MKYILRIIDFETTGLPDEDNEHSVCEFAFVDICAQTKALEKAHGQLVKPTTGMDIEAQATHHISPEEAQAGLPWESAKNILENESKTPETIIIYVAHNADYEKNFFNPDGAKWVDTYKVALKLYPDAPRHTNQVLKYYLGIDNKPDHHPPHRALPDCMVTADVLLMMSKEMSFNDMIQVSKQPPYLTRIAFGKHRGEKFEDLPRDYLEWLSKQSDLDEGVNAAIKRVLW